MIFFIKWPQVGKVKTRLENSLPNNPTTKVDFTLAFYRSMVEYLLGELQSLSANVYVYFSPPEQEANVKSWLGPNHTYRSQIQGDLGEKMHQAFLSCFADDCDSVLIVGSDTILKAQELTAFLKILEKEQAIIGPSTDGGYYLIGFQKTSYFAEIFQGIEWSTPQVFPDTIEKFQKQGITVEKLASRNDIDTYEDLLENIRENRLPQNCMQVLKNFSLS